MMRIPRIAFIAAALALGLDAKADPTTPEILPPPVPSVPGEKPSVACIPHEQLTKKLKEEYGEQAMFLGAAPKMGSMFELFVNPKTKSWSIVRIMPVTGDDGVFPCAAIAAGGVAATPLSFAMPGASI